ncbi:class I SAM-dependent methyltransferase [[Clostridium] hylemonae]|uniref:Methyltransferase domain protein n=1 Tax=[Clostridium] hylemonae DSM 15053 TaxID=553973 RepID=C0C5V1_9FIRM|nr:class I SAM-dependent methyltransferase [[Clostridium] hylemonae]EEG72485.1 methyltransferase domain protein [[Clostridium] hylemonae DSM 15053]QEK16657.1 27-O-demethylrifamycin SV methyltransferase [[Clostridium] hylemonae DSM 15053]
MKENKYDSDSFFKKYSEMSRSQQGLKGAGEWSELQKVLPDFRGKCVLDLGCGYGWHCLYAAQNGAEYVLGTDISAKMLETAREKNSHERIEYRRCAMEDLELPDHSFDVVLSSLAFHYVKEFQPVVKKISRVLSPGGFFVFSAEHPVFTAYGTQDWYYDEQGEILHFPVDNYYFEGKRDAVFLGEPVTKYHRTLTTYLNTLLENGFELLNIIEPQPPDDMLHIPGMADEMRRPMMLIVKAVKRT